jgi:hypothetical protein
VSEWSRVIEQIGLSLGLELEFTFVMFKQFVEALALQFIGGPSDVLTAFLRANRAELKSWFAFPFFFFKK